MSTTRSIRQILSPPILTGTVVLLAIVAIGAGRVVERYLVEEAYRSLEEQLATVTTLFMVAPESVTSPNALETVGRRSGIVLFSISPDAAADSRLPDLSEYRSSVLQTLAVARLVTVARNGPPPFRSGEPFIVARAAAGPSGTRFFVAIRESGGVRASITRIRRLLAISVAVLTTAFLALAYPALNILTAPIRQLIEQSAQFAAGNLERRSRIWAPRELKQLSDNLNDMATQLDARIEAIRNQRNELDTVLATMSEALVLVDGEDRIRTMNDAARRLFLTREGESHRPLLVTVRNAEVADLVHEARLSETSSERSITLYRSEPVDLHVRATPLQLGEEQLVLLVFTDVTRLNRLERIRQDFVSSVSHELKTPITAIQGFVETLADGSCKDPEQSDRFFKIVLTHAHRLGAIVEDLLQLSRIEQNEEVIETEPLRVEEIVHAARFAVDAKAAERKVRIHEEYAGSPECIGNRGLLERAVINLVDNAVKYSPEGGAISIRCVNRSDLCSIEVKDEGPGIPRSERERVFERFYRIDKARSRDLGGTGLGLAIVKHVARVHGGNAYARDHDGGGSEFVIEIPQVRSATPVQTALHQ